MSKEQEKQAPTTNPPTNNHTSNGSSSNSNNNGDNGGTAPPPRKKSIEEIKAEARAHALSGGNSSKNKKRPLWQQAAHVKQQQAAAAATPYPPYPPPYPYPPPHMPPPPHVPPPSQAGKAKDDGSTTAAPPPTTAPYPPYPPYPYPYYPPPPGYPPYPPPPPPPPSSSSKKDGGEGAAAAAAAAAAAYHHHAWHHHHAAAAYAAAAYPGGRPPPHPSSTTTSTNMMMMPPRPPPPPPVSGVGGSTTATPSTTTNSPLTAAVILKDPDVDEYTKFVKAMQIRDWWKLFEQDDDDDDDDADDYQMDDKEDDDDDDDDDDDENDDNDDENDDNDDEGENDEEPNENKKEMDGKPPADGDTEATDTGKSTTTTTTTATPSVEPVMDDLGGPLDLTDDDSVFYRELREELGWLEEEDMEAAVATLLQDTTKQPPTLPHDAGGMATEGPTNGAPGGPGGSTTTASAAATTTPTSSSWPHTPLRGQGSSKTQMTAEQYALLGDLMKKHYQLLVQQAVLAIRAAHAQKYHNRILSRVAATVKDDDSEEEKKRKYSTSFWMGHESSDEIVECLDGAIGMLQDLNENRKDAFRQFIQSSPQAGSGRLTRAQFQKSLKELSQGAARTVFDIPGISNLSDTFALIDKSVQATGEQEPEEQVLLEADSAEDACKMVLEKAKAAYDPSIVPGSRDLSLNFSDAREYCGDDFTPPCSSQQDLLFRRNRNLFSAGEDNLVLRGVNLYGEKQWILIADRFLPERSIHIISQRYSKLCMMIYMANGVKIDDEGLLEKPPPVTDVLSKRQQDFIENLKPLNPPAVLNVHRWSLKEDLCLLKAVPILGNSWAKLGTYLIPYRDRGHLRKRYQVLERRVKSTMTRTQRKDFLEALNVRPQNKQRPSASKSRSHLDVKPGPYNAFNVSSPTKARNSTPYFATPQRQKTPSTMQQPGTSPYPYPPPYSPYSYPYPPPMYSPGYPYPPPQMYDETSRAAFEKLAQESKGDWSQMSYMQNIVMSPAHHAQGTISPKQPGNEETAKDEEEGKDNDGKRGSLLGNVLQSSGTVQAGPSEGKDAPSTPAMKGTVYSTNGTPIGLSETFRTTPARGDYLDAHLHGYPGVYASNTMQSFPANSRWSTTEASSSGNNSGDVQQTTGTSSSIPETSMDSLATYDSSYIRARTARPLFGDGTTLLDTDLEAVSALNILSNSPALKRKALDTEERNNDDNDDNKQRAQPKSLFAAVVNGSAKKKQRNK